MQRAGVFIGVNKTGSLRPLHDAAASARRMHSWAARQGMSEDAAILVTDEPSEGPVTPDRIQDAVQQAIGTGPEQLIVYFAGHGVVIRKSERWLLSGAPKKADHAVDMGLSSVDARTGQVGHVVLISDACRTAPKGIQAQSVRGISLFDNTPGEEHRFVDLYYACGLGRAAVELRTDEEEAADAYRAVYTEVLLEALGGKYADSLVQRHDKWFVETRPLRDLLAREVPVRIRDRKLNRPFFQGPQADISSDPGAWLSRIETLPWDLGRTRRSAPDAGRFTDETPAPTLQELQEHSVARAIAGDTAYVDTVLAGLTDDVVPGGNDFAHDYAAASHMFGPGAFETACGFKVSGATVSRFFTTHPVAELMHDGTSLRLAPPGDGLSVLLGFSNGLVTLLPAVPGFITALIFDEDELISVDYEPSENTWRSSGCAETRKQLRTLRTLAAASSLRGSFILDTHESRAALESMITAGSCDPTLAIYAAYAYSDQNDVDRIRHVSESLAADIGTTFFDLELLGRRHLPGDISPAERVLPAVPLLTRGWTVVRAQGTQLPADLNTVEQLAEESLWSVYAAAAWDPFRRSLAEGAIR